MKITFEDNFLKLLCLVYVFFKHAFNFMHIHISYLSLLRHHSPDKFNQIAKAVQETIQIAHTIFVVIEYF